MTWVTAWWRHWLGTARPGCWLLLAYCVLVGACVPMAHVKRRVPGQAHLPGVVNLSRGDFAGEGGEDFAELLTQRFVTSKAFTVLTDDADTSDEPDATFRGKLVRADYSENERSKRGDCFKANLKKYKCVTNKREGRSTCSAQVDVVNPLSQALFVSQELTVKETAATEAIDEPAPAIDGEALRRKCLVSLSQKFAEFLAPHEVVEVVALEEDGELPMLEIGNGQLIGEQYEPARQSYAAAIERAQSLALDPESVGRAHYNLAVAYAVVSDYDKALEHLKEALAICACKAWIELSARVNRWKADAESARLQD